MNDQIGPFYLGLVVGALATTAIAYLWHVQREDLRALRLSHNGLAAEVYRLRYLKDAQELNT